MSRSEVQNQKIKDVRKDKIREAAIRQFAAKGFAATRIKDIAESADMAQGLLYHYYPSKEAIFTDLIEDALNKLNEACLYVRNLDSAAIDKLWLFIRELIKTIETSDRFRQTCCLIAQAENPSLLPESAKQRLDEKRDLPYKIIAEVMKQGQDEGSLVDGSPHDLAVLFWSSINGLSIYRATRKNAGPMPEARFLAGMFEKKI